MNYKERCEELVGCTLRHQFTGQIRHIVHVGTSGVLFKQARWYGWGPFGSSSFVKTHKSAEHWLRSADVIAERGQSYTFTTQMVGFGHQIS